MKMLLDFFEKIFIKYSVKEIPKNVIQTQEKHKV